ncbi:MAG: efflux RND transporter periplasmic adaptor subunit [Myxococcales bacterium]|nr:efflux RND transporter periplasmic adaptor subunit [Myxococcales bacterium]
MTKRSWWRVAFALAIVLFVVAGVLHLSLRGPRVSVVAPVRGTVTETVVSSGRVLAPAEINLGALVASSVREVHVREGDAVRVGQLLVQLDDTEALAAVQQAEAALAQAQAGRFELERLSEPAARSDLGQAEANLEEAKRDLQRSKTLFDAGFGTQAELDQAQTAHAVAKSQREAARLRLRATTEGGSQSLLSSASVAVATAQLERARAELAHTRLTSPVDGVVLARNVEPGDAVMIGSKLLLLSRTGATRLVIEPDERNLARLAVGQRALASAEAFADQRFDAVVQYIAPSVDPQRGTVEVHLGVAAPPDYLRPNMTVSVEVTIGERDDTLLLPRGAVQDLAGDAPYVWRVEAGRATRQPVEIGMRGDQRVEILDGLDEAARVILEVPASLSEGARVRTVLAEPGGSVGE